PVNALGEWEYTFAPALAQGNYVFNASVVTPAGGESPLTADFNLEIDTTPSAPPSIDEISDDVGTIQGPIADGASTDDTTPTLGGSGEPGDVIIIRNNGTELARVTVQSDGTWSFTPNPPLNHGSTNVFDVIAQDPAGNQSAPSAPWTIVIDTVGPLTTITSVIDDSSGSPVPIGSGESTTDRTPTVNGTSEPDSEISIFNNGELIGTATADASGNWNFTPDMPLNSGSYNLTAISVDPAGNTGPVSNAVDFMIGSVFGSVKGIEDFEGFASNFELLQGVTHALESMDITVLSPLTADTWVNIRGTHQVDQVLGFSGVVSPTVQFDLKGETASTLILHLDYVPSDSRTNEIRFYDAEGSLIHTHLLNAAGPGAQFGVEQVTMPDDLKFSSFQIQINGNVNNIILSDAPILIEEFSAFGSFFEFPVDVEVELDLFTITRMKSSHGGSSYMDVRGSDSYGTNKNLQLANGAANFDLQGKLASTLNMHAYFISAGGAAIPGNVEFRFYNAEGELIHTMDPGVLHWKSGWTSYSLPEGMQFASFQIETSQYGNIAIDEISFADLMLPDQPPVTETTKTVAQVIEIHEGEEGTVLAEGNAMIDTLMLTGAGQVLDLTVLGDKVSSIEVIDITGTGDNTLNLSLGDVLEQGGTNLFTGDDTTQMMIKGNAGDIVNLDDLLPDGTDPGDWATAGTATVAGVVYNVYQHSTLDAQLLVQDGVTTNLV
ncbi:MAG: Ig-like domain-containing protein, partial [Pseudomonas proteolytica]|uniref:Ig-like domain-containing protein n=1 Tax=Pseudomonas proteolytica TaxID=219574 RepID=UPI003F3ACB41